jgi:hypothetical protein
MRNIPMAIIDLGCVFKASEISVGSPCLSISSYFYFSDESSWSLKVDINFYFFDLVSMIEFGKFSESLIED